MYQDIVVRGMLLSEMKSDKERIEALVMDVRRWRHVCRGRNYLKSATIALIQAAEGRRKEGNGT